MLEKTKLYKRRQDTSDHPCEAGLPGLVHKLEGSKKFMKENRLLTSLLEKEHCHWWSPCSNALAGSSQGCLLNSSSHSGKLKKEKSEIIVSILNFSNLERSLGFMKE